MTGQGLQDKLNANITNSKMTRTISFLLVLITGLSCNSGKQESTEAKKDKANEGKANDNIRFDFKAKIINTPEATLVIDASLCNYNEDTVCFLSSTCDGEQYSLRYDTSKFTLTPYPLCNASWPIMIKIAPGKQHSFQAHFRCHGNESKIKLGFDFYSVDKSFNLTNKKLGDLNIFNRPKAKQTIIWAEEQTIK